jgi:hypothetical protein
MQMIRQFFCGNQLVPLSGNNGGDVFLQFIVVLRQDAILPAFNRNTMWM